MIILEDKKNLTSKISKIKFHIIDQIHFLEYRNSRLVQYIDGLCMFKNINLCFFNFPIRNWRREKKVLTNIYIRSWQNVPWHPDQ